MNGKEINLAIRNALTDLIAYSDELGDLDAAIGDGDLGVTVSLGAKAVIASLKLLPEDATPAEIARACATSFSDANPSTIAALVGGALLAGSRLWDGKSKVDISDVASFTKAAADSIAKNGQTKLGDKTILDAIVPAADALAADVDPEAALDGAIAAAENAVEKTKALQSRRGRASWLQERSVGLQDPGATAFWFLLRSWKASN
jgi:phosphoenolpyruvate---glycerone phosphotransferase subunit DhaL